MILERKECSLHRASSPTSMRSSISSSWRLSFTVHTFSVYKDVALAPDIALERYCDEASIQKALAVLFYLLPYYHGLLR